MLSNKMLQDYMCIMYMYIFNVLIIAEDRIVMPCEDICKSSCSCSWLSSELTCKSINNIKNGPDSLHQGLNAQGIKDYISSSINMY